MSATRQAAVRRSKGVPSDDALPGQGIFWGQGDWLVRRRRDIQAGRGRVLERGIGSIYGFIVDKKNRQ